MRFREVQCKLALTLFWWCRIALCFRSVSARALPFRHAWRCHLCQCVLHRGYALDWRTTVFDWWMFQSYLWPPNCITEKFNEIFLGGNLASKERSVGISSDAGWRQKRTGIRFEWFTNRKASWFGGGMWLRRDRNPIFNGCDEWMKAAAGWCGPRIWNFVRRDGQKKKKMKKQIDTSLTNVCGMALFSNSIKILKPFVMNND